MLLSLREDNSICQSVNRYSRSIYTIPACPKSFPHVFHAFAPPRCSTIICRDCIPVARVHFLQCVPQHIATPLLLYGPVPRASDPQLHSVGGCQEGASTSARARGRARPPVYVLTPVLPSVYVHFGIRRMDASPRRVRSRNSRRSVRQRETSVLPLQ